MRLKCVPPNALEWGAVDYLQSKQLRNRNRAAQHRAKLLAAARPLLEVALASDRGRGASPVDGNTTPPGELAAADEPPIPSDHSTRHKRKRPVHYPWPFVSPQLLNTKGEEIYFPVVDDKDRCWARRLEWAIDHHRDLDEAELNGLQAHFEKVLRRSRDHNQLYIKSLQQQLESAHKRLRELRRP